MAAEILGVAWRVGQEEARAVWINRCAVDSEREKEGAHVSACARDLGRIDSLIGFTSDDHSSVSSCGRRVMM